MADSTNTKRLSWQRARVLTAAALLSGMLAAGCGASAGSPTATVGGASTSVSTAAASATSTTRSSTATGGGAASSRSTAQSAGGSGPLAFAKCMRANGVPNFPDPSPGGGFLFPPAGINRAAPAFMAATAKCQKLMGGGPPGPGSTTHPSAQTLAKLVNIARCMRQHGVPEFPDPRTSIPSNPALAGIAEITNFDGVILLFPSAMNLQAPAYRQALTACGAPPLGLPH
jgi:hypothetical protein